MVDLRFVYALTGMFVGLVTIILGIYLFRIDRRGVTNFKLKFGYLNISISTGFPGLIFVVVGVLIIYFSRYS